MLILIFFSYDQIKGHKKSAGELEIFEFSADTLFIYY